MYNSDLPSRAELPSSRQLVRSTLIAVISAVALLVAVVLPAEYGLDPTGIGRMLGLTEMGEIKQQLANEAALEAPDRAPTNQEDNKAAAETKAEAMSAEPTAEPAAEAPVDLNASDASDASEPTEHAWRDELSRTLAPAEGKEIKLVMQQGDRANYEWTVNQGHLNSDLHTDNGPGARSLSYRQGRAETSVTDGFTAASDGAHGWFWRNRSNETVTVTLRVRGTYREIKR